ncbi:MAG: hypothetical protein AB1Y26_08440 [Cycloclasticus sp.]
METDLEHSFVEQGTLKRPGPIGRLVRLLFAAVCGWFLVWLILAGPAQLAAQFPYIIELWLWALLALYLFPYVINIGFGRDWGRRPQLIVIACGCVASILSYTIDNNVWGAPLAWFIIAWLFYVYTHLAISFFLSAILATPGCEMRALPHLLAIMRNRPPLEHHCPVGPLSRIDAWESKKRSGSKNER